MMDASRLSPAKFRYGRSTVALFVVIFYSHCCFSFVSDVGELVLWRLFQAGDLHLGLGVTHKGKFFHTVSSTSKRKYRIDLYQCCGSGMFIPDHGVLEKICAVLWNRNRNRRNRNFLTSGPEP